MQTDSPYSSLERELTGSSIFRKRAESLSEGVSEHCTEQILYLLVMYDTYRYELSQYSRNITIQYSNVSI